jgi:hypothetical protein
MMGGACKSHGIDEKLIQNYSRKIQKEEATCIRLHKHRWKNNIKKNHKEIVCGDVDWILLARDRDE